MPGQPKRSKSGPGRPPNLPSTTRDRLVEAAATLFNEEGYFGTDTNKIARSAGYAPATFYKYFANKKEAFLEAYSRWVAVDWDIIANAIEPGRPPRRAARDMVKQHLKRHAEWTGFRRSMHALIAIDEDAQAFYMQARNTQLDRMTSLLNAYGAPHIARPRLLYSFLCVERGLNAATDEDLKALGVSRRALVQILEDEIVFQLTGHYN